MPHFKYAYNYMFALELHDMKYLDIFSKIGKLDSYVTFMIYISHILERFVLSHH